MPTQNGGSASNARLVLRPTSSAPLRRLVVNRVPRNTPSTVVTTKAVPTSSSVQPMVSPMWGRHRAAVAERDAEIAPEQPAHVVAELAPTANRLSP